jgi:DNA-binding MarR family transcriptional regulator
VTTVAPPSTQTSVLASGLRLAVTRLSRRLRSERAVGALTAGRFSALMTLDVSGPLSPSALAEHERVQPPSMTRIIASLEEDGFISRAPHPSDRRQFVLTLTDAGRTTVADEKRRKEAWLAKQLATLSEDERALIAAALPVIERIAGT